MGLQPVIAIWQAGSLSYGDVKQTIHGRGEALRVAQRRKPHDLRGIILPKAEIHRHPLPQHADGMGIGNLLDHLQPRLAASSQPGGRRLPNPIHHEYRRGFQPGCMIRAGRVGEMMRDEVKVRGKRGDVGDRQAGSLSTAVRMISATLRTR